MPQEIADRDDLGSVFQEVGRKGVSGCVKMLGNGRFENAGYKN
jgi:hypothetical protein